jgi:glutathione S-transferase
MRHWHVRAISNCVLAPCDRAAGSSGQFLCGSNPSIADLSSCEELLQVYLYHRSCAHTLLPPLIFASQLSVIQKDFSKYPRVAAWLDAMRALPDFDSAHTILQVSAAGSMH